MRLFLVRHGETVDNVAGIYAGTRDSPLTAHGVLQARRLATHLASLLQPHAPVTHIFSSDLRRAVDTARAIVDSQQQSLPQPAPPHPPPPPSPSSLSLSTTTALDDSRAGGKKDDYPDGPGSLQPPPPPRTLQLVQLPELRERDFGAAEGKKFGFGGGSGGGVSLADAGAETHEALRGRAERFVRERLEPLLLPLWRRPRRRCGEGSEDRARPPSDSVAVAVVVVVAHGLILRALLGVLLARFGSGAGAGTGLREPVRDWANTGYAELVFVQAEEDGLPCGGEEEVVNGGENPAASGERRPSDLAVSPPTQHQRRRIAVSLVGVNVLTHLEGLKKTRGGIGSAAFDKRQRTMDSFFAPAAKKQRAGQGSGGP